MHLPSLFYSASTPKEKMWDTWLYHHNERFYLYYMAGPIGEWNAIAMATSDDGIHWRDFGRVIGPAEDVALMGAGSVWRISCPTDEAPKFIMNFCETRGSWPDTRTTISFAESLDLIHWKRLDSRHEFAPDERWYQPTGRWENIWTVPRPEGGFYGYWAATSNENRAGLGFGETLDGVTWKALPPPVLHELLEPSEINTLINKLPQIGSTYFRSPEIGAIHNHNNKFYAMLGLYDREPMLDIHFRFRPGETTFVADSPFGPFSPAQKNRRLLVGNASYFCRFLQTPNGLLVNHHSWQIDSGQPLGVNSDHVYMAPLKQAAWDPEGTLRLTWWKGYENAKRKSIPINIPESKRGQSKLLLSTLTDEKKTLILEGKISLQNADDASFVGLYFQNAEDDRNLLHRTVFLVRNNSIVEYGVMLGESIHFIKEDEANRELAITNDPIHFRLIKKGPITEFYLNDILMQCYCLPEQNAKHVGLLGPLKRFGEIAAWQI